MLRLLGLGLVFCFSSSVTALTCQDLDGAYLLSNDANSRYLGFFGNEYASESVMNSFGTYGSPYAVNSVRNSYGTYGSSYSSYSAQNPYATNPPVIYRYGVPIAYLTTNSTLSPSVSLSAIDSSCIFYSTAPTASITLPSPPSAVSVADGADEDNLSVTWTQGANATSYNVYISQSNSNYQFLGNTAGFATSISNLQAGITYYVAVTGVNSVGESSTYRYDTGFLASAPESYTVIPSVYQGVGGSINPSDPQTVSAGESVSFVLTPDAGYETSAAHIGGTCGGLFYPSSSTYVTNPVNQDCTVSAGFFVSIDSYSVTPSTSEGGSITPATVQTIQVNDTVSFTLSAEEGYELSEVGGTCGGSLNGMVFTTDPIVEDCSVNVIFQESVGVGLPIWLLYQATQ